MRKTKTIIPNTENLPIKEYWDKLPKRNGLRDNLLAKLAKQTGRQSGTIRCWFLGTALPPTPKLKQQVADIVGSTVEVLFPNNDNTQNVN